MSALRTPEEVAEEAQGRLWEYLCYEEDADEHLIASTAAAIRADRLALLMAVEAAYGSRAGSFLLELDRLRREIAGGGDGG